MKQLLNAIYIGFAVPVSIFMMYGDEIWDMVGLGGFILLLLSGVYGLFGLKILLANISEIRRIDVYRVWSARSPDSHVVKRQPSDMSST